MIVRSLGHQLLRDLKASWQKTAILGSLFLVGLIFWIPPLIRAAKGRSAAIPVASAPAPVNAEAASSNPIASATGSSLPTNWQTVERVLNADPLVRSADIAAVVNSPFRLDRDQFPPPALFAAEAQEPPRREPSEPSAAAALTGLVLKSTIVGTTRRAAYINTKLYFEGNDVRGGDGQLYRLSAVYPRKVILAQGTQNFELKIAGRAPLPGVDLQGDVTDDSQ